MVVLVHESHDKLPNVTAVHHLACRNSKRGFNRQCGTGWDTDW